MELVDSASKQVFMNMTAFYTLIHREVYRFLRLFKQTIIPPVISTLLYILIFGYSLGKNIKQIEGFDYIIYILPGLAQMGVINHAYQNSSTSLFLSKMERSIENFLVAPLHYLEIVSAFVVGSIMRGLAVGICILFVSYFFIDLPLNNIWLLLVSLVLTGALFGAVGILFALLADSWEHIAAFGNFVLMPLVFLGGTFYSIKLLPSFWQKVSIFNPLFYAVDSTRYAILGKSDVIWYYSFVMMVMMTSVLLFVCVWLFKRGYNLRT